MKVKLIAVIIAFILMFTCTACSKPTGSEGKSDKAGNLDEVKLKMILVGDRPSSFDEIYTQINAMLKKDINATLQVEYIPMGDLEKKYPLIFAANEQFDLAFSATWVYYQQISRRNGFLELTEDLVKKYAPQSWNATPKEAWEQVKVGGKVYMLPGLAPTYSGTRVVGARGDLRKKYGIKPLETLGDLEGYLAAIAENEKGLIAWGDIETDKDIFLMMQNNLQTVGNLTKYIAYKNTDSKVMLMNVVESPEYEEFVKKMKSYGNRNFWPKDIISNKSVSKMFENGKCATKVNNLATVSTLLEDVNNKHPEWEVELYDFSKGKKKGLSSYASNGMSIHETSENPERALMLLDLFKHDKRYFELTNYGIEGKHWKEEADNRFTSLNESLPKNEQYIAGCVWGWGNNTLKKISATEFKATRPILERWEKEETTQGVMPGFVFDDSNTKNELVNVENVVKQYATPLEVGMVDNVDNGLAVLRQKLKEAGIEKIIKEMQQQIDKYFENVH